MEQIFTVFVVGPTASGKTKLGVELAKRLNGEVVSADSMQLYKKMDIATAKPTKEETENIAHHLIDFVEPSENYSVARYKLDALSAIHDIHSRGKTPIVVGGTGLYIDTLINNIEFMDFNVDGALRKKIEERAETEGLQKLYEELCSFDEQTAKHIHPNNKKKIIHALEVYYQTGKTLSYQVEHSKQTKSSIYPVIFGLNAKNRDYLYDRINLRVEKMLDDGLIEEMKSFYENESSDTSNQAIGYKEFLPYITGECTFEECKENLKIQTRHYAKRQLTWFRKNESIHWLYIDEMSLEQIVNYCIDLIKGVENEQKF